MFRVLLAYNCTINCKQVITAFLHKRTEEFHRDSFDNFTIYIKSNAFERQKTLKNMFVYCTHTKESNTQMFEEET